MKFHSSGDPHHKAVVSGVPDGITPKTLREWWHGILKAYGKYSCCAIMLALPTDAEAIQYLGEWGQEIDLLSGKDCLVLAVCDTFLLRYGFDENSWRFAVSRQVSSSQSIEIANLLGIKYSEFPCVVVFQDIRASEHLVISLKQMTVDEISQRMRAVFSIIHSAAAEKHNPLHELIQQGQREELQRAGQSIVGALRNAAGKTFDAAVEAWIKSTLRSGS